MQSCLRCVNILYYFSTNQFNSFIKWTFLMCGSKGLGGGGEVEPLENLNFLNLHCQLLKIGLGSPLANNYISLGAQLETFFVMSMLLKLFLWWSNEMPVRCVSVVNTQLASFVHMVLTTIIIWNICQQTVLEKISNFTG